ncbi:MAG TPA: Rpn family recombination-promoting nuclease/putative transposase [Phycisphaerae bacterium]|jgi:predicted transposase/invertase (TIGR01784 family)
MAVRRLFQQPQHLRALLQLCHPELATRLDFRRVELIERSFVSEEYRQREADLLFRLPHRDDHGAVLVYILLEHQSQADRWMPLRLLSYMLAIWDEQRRRQRRGAPRLAPIIPLVFYTGKRK